MRAEPKASPKVRQIFTFSIGEDDPNRNGYVIVHGHTPAECRNKMFARYGKRWSFQYDTEEQAGVEQYELHLVGVLH